MKKKAVKLQVGDVVYVKGIPDYHWRVTKIDGDEVHTKSTMLSERNWTEVHDINEIVKMKRYAHLKPTRNGQFRFNLHGDNHEIIATSEAYTSQAMAVKTLKKYFPSFRLESK